MTLALSTPTGQIRMLAKNPGERSQMVVLLWRLITRICTGFMWAFVSRPHTFVHYGLLTGAVMLAETVSLGILTLPWSISKLGLIPGLLLVFFSGVLATYTGYVYGQFKLAHPQITDVAGAAYVLGQALPWPRAAVILREVIGCCAVLVLVFIQAAHVIGFALMVNAIKPNNGVCAIVWYLLGALIQLILTLPRTMRNTSYISGLSSLSVLVAVIMVMANVSRTYPGGNKEMDYWKGSPGTEFSLAFTGVLNIVLSYTGHVAYLSFASELRDPRDFHKALFFQLASATTLYTIVAVRSTTSNTLTMILTSLSRA